jgi:hypothetical protein
VEAGVRAGIIGAITTILLLAACAGRRGKCESVPDNYLKPGGKPVYRACAVNRPVKGPSFGTKWNYNSTQSCGRATIEFVVNEYGIPDRETARVITGNDTRLGEEMVLFLTSMRYEPAQRNGAAVQQLTTWERSYTRTRTNTKAPRSAQQAQGPAKC